MRDWLASHGVEHYFHRPFVWFGPRTRFRHFTTRFDFRATEQTLAENDVYIFDMTMSSGSWEEDSARRDRTQRPK